MPDLLDHLRRSKAEDCVRCRLHRGRSRLVFGTGNPDADMVLVGEAPGANEDQTGEPFVGDAGHLLDGFLRRVELAREDLYICNLLKCRPPGNRDPEPDEITACAPFLHTQLRLIRPKVIVALGRFAGRVLTGESEDAPLGYMRRHDWFYSNRTTGVRCPIIVTYHPAYVLRNKGNKQAAKEAATKIMVDLNRAIAVIEGW